MRTIRKVLIILLALAMLFGSVSLAASTTPAPSSGVSALNVDGTVSGKVVNVTEKDIVINLENGNTVMFMLDYLGKTDAIVGDTVSIEYNGNVIDSPQAVTVTVTQKVLGGLSISGTVMTFDENRVFIVISSNNAYGFVKDKTTTISGLEKVLADDDEVTITYTGDLNSIPFAKDINITKLATGKSRTSDSTGRTTNKTLDGYVSALTSKIVTIYTNSGKSYSFKLSKDVTKISGNYDLETGCRIRVTYDGYASVSPLAKSIRVLSKPSPITPKPVKPTPTPGHKTHTVSGTVTYFNGVNLELSNGGDYDTSFAVFSGTGYGEYGESAKVTYYVSENGVSYATKVVLTAVKPTATPKPDTRTVSGTVAAFGGMYLELTSGMGFDVTYATYSGNGDRVEGDSAKVTYYTDSDGLNYATKVVFTSPTPTNTPKPETHTVTGTVAAFGGMYLELTSGMGFDVTYATYSGNGERTEGDTAKVTYYVGSDGMNYATKVVFTAPDPDPYVPEPAPEPDPYDPEPEPDPSEFEE